jgi:hypothetical protein
VWISDYNPAASGPNLFGDFPYSTFWQYTDAARVGGIGGAVDGNYFHGSRNQLDVFSYVGSPPPITNAKPSASLSLTVASTVPAGHPLWMSGKLIDGNSRMPLGGKTFSVWRKTTGQTAFTKVFSGQTFADGTAFYATSQTRTNTYQFRLDPGAAGTGFPAVTSPERTVTT